MKNKKILIFIPTYNEKDNVRVIIKKINENFSYIDVLFIDDDSPDGTGDILELICEEQKNVSVIRPV